MPPYFSLTIKLGCSFGVKRHPGSGTETQRRRAGQKPSGFGRGRHRDALSPECWGPVVPELTEAFARKISIINKQRVNAFDEPRFAKACAKAIRRKKPHHLLGVSTEVCLALPRFVPPAML